MILATNNSNKTKQFKMLFPELHLKSLKDLNIKIDINENGKTFEENAIIKAKAIYNLTGQSVLADDSGIAINELNGWPGVETHRIMDKNSTNDQRNAMILEKMKNIPQKKRGCKVICSLALCDKSGKVYTTSGILDRFIAFSPKGENKFGFDEIVEIMPGITLAELNDEEKNQTSARSIASKKMRHIIASFDSKLL